MESNSQIFTTTVFGNSSGLTQEQLNQKNTETVEMVYQERIISKMNNRQPIVPSNQHIAKD
jgi:hypothetical protein